MNEGLCVDKTKHNTWFKATQIGLCSWFREQGFYNFSIEFDGDSIIIEHFYNRDHSTIKKGNYGDYLVVNQDSLDFTFFSKEEFKKLFLKVAE